MVPERRPIPGANAPSLIISNVQRAEVGSYIVRVSTSTRSALSAAAILEIGPELQTITQDKFRDALAGETPLPRKAGVIARSAAGSVVAGVLGSQILDNFGSTKELGEPNHGGIVGGASRWFRLEPIEDGLLRVDTEGSAVDTVLAVYAGTNLLNLRLVASDDNSGSDGKTSQLSFPARAGASYLVAVDSVGGATGGITVHWQLGLIPTITQQPPNQKVSPGITVTFVVVATGKPELSYQWLFNGSNITGATNSTLVLSDVGGSNAGSYRVLVSNFAGSEVSSDAMLEVEPGSALRLESWAMLADGTFRLQFRTDGQAGYVVEASTDLSAWLPIWTNRTADFLVEFLDPIAFRPPIRFYRVSKVR